MVNKSQKGYRSGRYDINNIEDEVLRQIYNNPTTVRRETAREQMPGSYWQGGDKLGGPGENERMQMPA